MLRETMTANLRSLLVLPAVVASLAGALAPAGDAPSTASVVKLEKTEKGFRLLRNGEPYFILGAGGKDHLEALRAAGANSIRTWGADKIEDLLDKAHACGLTVTIGIWLGHPEHGFRYSDPKAVAEQLARAKDTVAKYRAHPALLFWALGNEVEIAGDDPKIWDAIEEMAKMVKESDPNHPVMTVVAEIWPKKIEQIKGRCPSLDALGINSYGGASSLPRRLKEGGWEKPYIVTEFGPFGQTEVGRTEWGAPSEPSSTQKAGVYLTHYLRAVASQPGWCLGSYAFLWGHKMEGTHTWYGLLLPNGDRLGAVDSVTFAWTGKWPANRSPEIVFLQTDADAKNVAPGSAIPVSLGTFDVDGDPLTVRWDIRSEKGDRKTGGELPAPAGAEPSRSFSVQTPAEPGAYRLFVYVHDGKGHAAVANLPFRTAVRPNVPAK